MYPPEKIGFAAYNTGGSLNICHPADIILRRLADIYRRSSLQNLGGFKLDSPDGATLQGEARGDASR